MRDLLVQLRHTTRNIRARLQRWWDQRNAHSMAATPMLIVGVGLPVSGLLGLFTHSATNFFVVEGFFYYGYVQNVVGFPGFLAQSSVLSTTGQGWAMRFVLTACYPAAGWNPPTTGPTNYGQAQTLLRSPPSLPH